jgi:UMF1 family MFS transporter
LESRGIRGRLYGGNTEALGSALDSIGRLVIFPAPGIFLTIALINLAKKEAGCETEIPEGDLKAPECNARVYGLKPSSLLTTSMTIVGFISACVLPIFGAVIDYTPRRKQIGFLTAVAQIFFTLGNVFLAESNWFLLTIMQVCNAFVGWVHTLTAFAYLPELTDDSNLLMSWNTSFSILQYFTLILFLGYMLGMLRATGFDGGGDNDDVLACRLASASALVVATPCYLWTWISLMKRRDAFHELPEGSSLSTIGFIKVYKTSKKLYSKYRALMWFFVNVAFVEAALLSIASISLTYMTDTLQMTADEGGIAILVLLVFSSVGAIIGKVSISCMNPIRSVQLSQALIAINTGVGALILYKPGQKFRAYAISAGWGIGGGWKNVVERFTACLIIPKGQDAEMMGFYLFSIQILAWLPTLIFTAMNEAGINQRIGLTMLIAFFLCGIFCLSMMGSYDEAVLLAMEEDNIDEDDADSMTGSYDAAERLATEDDNIHEDDGNSQDEK